MVRSNLTTKFHIHTVNEFQKKFRQDNEDAKKKNIARYITVDVINRKGVPDIEDCILLIKLGNTNCDEQQAEDILQRWLDDDKNKARGITGAFCELCKDYCKDVPVDSLHKEQCNQLEELINNRLEAQNKLQSLMEQLTKLKDNIDKASEETSAEEKNIDEFKEVNEEKPDELGVEIKDTQE
jgi:hypothetical protein